MNIIETHRIIDTPKGVRITEYLPGKLSSIPSRKGIKKAIKKGRVLVNGKVVSTAHFVRSGEKIELLEAADRKIYEFPLEVIVEDEHLAVIHKPAGIPVSGNSFRNVDHALPFTLKSSLEKDAYKYPRAVHRLDAKTSGLLLVAKRRSVHRHLATQFENREIDKTYVALVYGKTPVAGSVNLPINKKEALSHFERIRSVKTRNGALSLLLVKPVTGRTHQIRIHLAEEGYPIVGDMIYAKTSGTLKGKGLFLCAKRIEFTHPVTQKREICEIEIPYKFERRMERLEAV